MPLLTRDLVTASRKPYKKTYRLNPGQHWRDAEETASQWEAYVSIDAEEYEPIGASIARELIDAGAHLAGFIEMWAGRIVFVDQNLICQQIDGRLAEIIDTVRKANDGKLGGFPDVVGLFPDGRIAFREVKNIESKDRLGSKQHNLADLMRGLFGDQLDLQVVEWGGASETKSENKS